MKHLFSVLLAACVAGAAACSDRGRLNGDDTAEKEVVLTESTMKFVASKYDFGQVKEGSKVTGVYEAVNTGDGDVVFQSVTASCGCTVPRYSRKPVPPGEKGVIEVVFDTKGRLGKQFKTVMVVTNTEPSRTMLSFTCEVIPK